MLFVHQKYLRWIRTNNSDIRLGDLQLTSIESSIHQVLERAFAVQAQTE